MKDICDDCRNCANYKVSEVGCFGKEKQCKHLSTKEEQKLRKAIRLTFYPS